MEALDDLERYLTRAPVVHVAPSPDRGVGMHRLVMEGGLRALGRPEDGAAWGPVTVRRDAAAWVLARGLGWPDLLVPTVLRELPSPAGGGDVAWSVQVEWPDAVPDVDPERFPEEDLWRAAAFDALACPQGLTRRWLAVRAGGAFRLRLVGHADAFPPHVAAPRSPFYDLRGGQPIPGDVTGAVDDLTRALPALTLHSTRGMSLPTLLPVEAITALADRARLLAERGRLELP